MTSYGLTYESPWLRSTETEKRTVPGMRTKRPSERRKNAQPDIGVTTDSFIVVVAAAAAALIRLQTAAASGR